jgi:hypothetical protein
MRTIQSLARLAAIDARLVLAGEPQAGNDASSQDSPAISLSFPLDGFTFCASFAQMITTVEGIGTADHRGNSVRKISTSLMQLR